MVGKKIGKQTSRSVKTRGSAHASTTTLRRILAIIHAQGFVNKSRLSELAKGIPKDTLEDAIQFLMSNRLIHIEVIKDVRQYMIGPPESTKKRKETKNASPAMRQWMDDIVSQDIGVKKGGRLKIPRNKTQELQQAKNDYEHFMKKIKSIYKKELGEK